MGPEPPQQKEANREAVAAATLHDLLVSDIKRFDRESRKHKLVHRRAELFVIATAALTTVVAGLGLVLEGRERQIQFAVLTLSVIGTAVTSWAASRRARDLWQHEREVFYALKDVLRELDFRTSATGISVADVHELFQRSAGILGSSTAKWSRILQHKQPAPAEDA